MRNSGGAELSRVTTADGWLLDGVLLTPTICKAGGPVDVFLLVHGTGSNFYSPGVLERFAQHAVSEGLAVLRVNTRGHDGLARNAGRGRSAWGGAAYETISDCRQDFAAWLDFLAGRGYRRIGVVGHSLGGVKAIYALAHDPQPGVTCLVGLSPPRFCHQRLMADEHSDAFRQDFARAEELVSQGQGQTLITVRQPLPLVLTAAGFLAKYGPRDDYDELKYLPRVACATLILVGTKSVATSAAFRGLPEALEDLQRQHPELPLSVGVIAGADTIYSTCLDEPFQRTAAWLSRLDAEAEGDETSA